MASKYEIFLLQAYAVICLGILVFSGLDVGLTQISNFYLLVLTHTIESKLVVNYLEDFWGVKWKKKLDLFSPLKMHHRGCKILQKDNIIMSQ